MENDELPQLPPLEEVLKAIEGRKSSDSEDLAKKDSGKKKKDEGFPIKMECPILRRKTKGDGEIYVLEKGVACEHLERYFPGGGDKADFRCDINSRRCPYYDSYVKK